MATGLLVVASLACLAAVCVAAAVVPVGEEEVTYEGHRVFRVVPETAEHMQTLRRYLEETPELDVWQEPSLLREPVDIRIPPHRIAAFYNHFLSSDIPHDTFIDDVQEKINRHRRSTASGDIFDDYRSYDEIMRWLSDKVMSCTDRCSLVTIGQSYEGRDLTLIKIGTPGKNKERLWIDAGIHAREWISPATAMYIIDRLIGLYNVVDEVTQLVDTYDWFILPIINPDGYEYSRNTDRLWRKTRSFNASTGCRGVDANRNFDFKWLNDIRAIHPCSNTYAGVRPFSEPESRAVAAYILKLQADLSAGPVLLYLTLHSYSQLWMAPWGWTRHRPSNYISLACSSLQLSVLFDWTHRAVGIQITKGAPTAPLKKQSVGASEDPCSLIYAGPSPLSEPEVKATADFILALKGTWKLYLTLHSYKQLWMAPWGYTEEKPPNYEELMRAGRIAVDSLRSVHGTNYTLGSASSILYMSSGTSRDWAKGAAQIEYVYTVELRDKGEYGFLLPREQIRPCGQEVWVAVCNMVSYIKNTTQPETRMHSSNADDLDRTTFGTTLGSGGDDVSEETVDRS